MTKDANGQDVTEQGQGRGGKRLQIYVTDKQLGLIEAAAGSAGAHVNTWMVAQAMRGVAANKTGVPTAVVLTADVADRLRRIAAEQGVSLNRAVELLILGATDAVHGDGR